MPQTIDLIISQESGNKENAFDALTRGDSQSHSASTSPLSSRPTPGKNYARRRSGTPKASLSSRKRLLTTESSSIGKRRRVMLMDVMSSSSDDEQDHNSKSKGLKGINRSKTKLHKVAFAANPLEHGEGNSTVNFTLAEDLPGATSKNTSPKPTKKNSEVPEADESIAANNETTVLDNDWNLRSLRAISSIRVPGHIVSGVPGNEGSNHSHARKDGYECLVSE
ncbi:hypothetical protein CAPTEDRAFT_205526 [Capitella teleta]|uniref:Uncharacterized protein n=1 Tax=Capitella teleta TaxID=283909 RepID=R7TMI7_CAPTE|nr:hypothetical protein CAPTEDRAFT_205526 [Capitella teleta]|eukprot:ELT94747.1 hypothetical protein CAPTEDRAFT_205526 [Capitella teleta]